MLSNTKVVDIEISQPLQKFSNLGGYNQLKCIVRFHGLPMGLIFAPITFGDCDTNEIRRLLIERFGNAIATKAAWQVLSEGTVNTCCAEKLFQQVVSGKTENRSESAITVIVCPRQTNQSRLSDFLAALKNIRNMSLEVIVTVAKEARNFETLQTNHPEFCWLSTPDNNRSNQRNLAIQAANGEIIACIDEDCIVDENWINAVTKAFSENPDINALAGLTIPDKSNAETCFWFENDCYVWEEDRRHRYQLDSSQVIPWPKLADMQIGIKGNMAFRKSLFTKIGYYDPTLDQPFLNWNGSDLDLWSRILSSNQVVLYEPAMLLQYRTSGTKAELRSHVARNIAGFCCYLRSGWRKFPDLRHYFIKLAKHSISHLASVLFLKPGGVSRGFILNEILANFFGRRRFSEVQTTTEPAVKSTVTSPLKFMAVRTLDLDQPLADLTTVTEYEKVRIFVTANDTLIGSIDIQNAGHSVGKSRLQQAIAETLTKELLEIGYRGYTESFRSAFLEMLRQRLTSAQEPAHSHVTPKRLNADLSVSIIVPACDRPTDLESCLTQLTTLDTHRPVEIVVADNRPASGLSSKVVAKFPQVKLVEEARPGGSYARNAAIAFSTGDIIVMVDDDVTVPPDWLEKLIKPLITRPEVMAVTGNVLPKELESPAQLLFEELKGGLSQGFKSFEVDGNWLAAGYPNVPPIYGLGVSANAAFRASIFADPKIGLMDESMGPGMPSVGGEEMYLFYKILKAGHTLAYEANAYVWHRHRRETSVFYRQLRGHMKGGAACYLAIWLKEKDPRASHHLWKSLPFDYFLPVIYGRIRGKNHLPWRLIWNEIIGNYTGIWNYWQSLRLVKKRGLSAPYIPVAERTKKSAEPA